MKQADKIIELSRLEEIFKISLFEPPHSFVGLSRVIKEAVTDAPPQSAAFGVLIRIKFNQNVFRQVANFLLASFQMLIFRWYLTCRRGSVSRVYGIYPTVEAPTIIYELEARAEEYSNECVLPNMQSGWNACLRRILMRIGGFHPSLGGIIIVVE